MPKPLTFNQGELQMSENCETPEYKIRPLKHKDRKLLKNMFLKLVEESGDDSILSIISIKESGETTDKKEISNSYAESGFKIIKLLLNFVEDECASWFCDLLGVNLESYDELPFDIEAIVIKQIMESKEIGNFFSTALGLFNRIPGLENTSNKKRKR